MNAVDLPYDFLGAECVHSVISELAPYELVAANEHAVPTDVSDSAALLLGSFSMSSDDLDH